MAWCEGNGVEYVLGLAKNGRLGRAIGAEMEAARQQQLATGQPARTFRRSEALTPYHNSARRALMGALPGLTA